MGKNGVDNRKVFIANVDREMVYADIIKCADLKKIRVSDIMSICKLDSAKQIRDGKKNANKYLLLWLARTLREEGIKRDWHDYVLPEAEPEQMEMDTDAISPAPDKPLEDEFMNAMGALIRVIARAYATGYDFKITTEKVKQS